MRIATLLLVTLVLGTGSAGLTAQENGSTSPHGTLPKGLDCSACHNASGWKPARARPDFDHDRVEAFRLTGSHRKVRCSTCHLDLRFDGPKIPSLACASCHADVHLGSMRSACSACHNTTSFGAVPGLAVHARTAFPLSGAHTQLSCEACHRDDTRGAYTPLATDCVSCHAQAYATASFDHRAAGLSTNCVQCHGTLAWSQQVEYGHSDGRFPLLGAHARITCGSCHTLPAFGLLFAPADESDCIACHQADYQRVHAADQFPTDCLACHGLETWGGGSFRGHDAFFPITSGRHSSAECRTCHIVAQDYGVFSCLECHEHAQAQMDDKHRGRNGYVYDSKACYNCHPNGRKD